MLSSRQHQTLELKFQLKLRDWGAGSDLDGLNDEVGSDDDDQADDGAGKRAFGCLKFFRVASGEEEIKPANKEHDKKRYAGKRKHSLDEIGKKGNDTFDGGYVGAFKTAPPRRCSINLHERFKMAWGR